MFSITIKIANVTLLLQVPVQNCSRYCKLQNVMLVLCASQHTLPKDPITEDTPLELTAMVDQYKKVQWLL